MTKLFYTLLCVFSVSTMFAQTDIKGTVKDNSGVPVTGANVLIEGSSSGATTDFDGNYSFTTSVSGAQKIIVSFLGYETLNKTVTLSGGAMTLDFVMVEGGNTLDEVVLTASSTFRSQKETPNSISSLKAQELTRLNANSQADIVASIPGIVADGGGGEAATNIFVRGLPSGGQNDFSPIQYDGLTLAGYGLSSTAGDVYAKVDQGVKGVEFVRGGSSILYGAGSTAGVMNYISKTGDTNDENIINFEVATKGRVKGEFYSGGKVGGEDSNTYYAVSGFVRKDDGPLDFGLPTKGYQFRGNLKKKFENGSFTFYTQFIDDKAQFLLGLPLDGDSRERITGNDGETVYQLNLHTLEILVF
ncbi:TonB-dependent receptor [Algibacter lectus]|uniref:TonB-dependent receptor n=1 Tax=Algibacter lectus TaxID=221126 RepID=A0A090WRL3_9FLAO|nr:carboxypeptidase-like regulatory domain-containing protein [Algibacter lectus]GAL79666.1 TonB-dependent receptor [Algibacter lectus]